MITQIALRVRAGSTPPPRTREGGKKERCPPTPPALTELPAVFRCKKSKFTAGMACELPPLIIVASICENAVRGTHRAFGRDRLWDLLTMSKGQPRAKIDRARTRTNVEQKSMPCKTPRWVSTDEV